MARAYDISATVLKKLMMDAGFAKKANSSSWKPTLKYSRQGFATGRKHKADGTNSAAYSLTEKGLKLIFNLLIDNFDIKPIV